MSNDIHPIPVATDGTVPDATEPPHRRRASPWRRVAAGVALGLAVGGGAVAVAQLPLHHSQVGTVFTASQNPDDESTSGEPQQAARQHPDTGHDHEDD